MKTNYILAIALVAALSSGAYAFPTINIGNVNVPVSGSAAVDVYVTGLGTGVNALDAIDVIVSIGSAQGIAPAGEPKIVSVDVVTGTVFDGNSLWPAPGQVLAGSVGSGFPFDQIWQIDTITPSAASPDVIADGKLFTIKFDTSGAAPGSDFPFRVLGTPFDSSSFDSTFSNRTLLGVSFAGSNGTLHITPEPGSCALAATGVALIVGWRWRRRRVAVTSPIALGH